LSGKFGFPASLVPKVKYPPTHGSLKEICKSGSLHCTIASTTSISARSRFGDRDLKLISACSSRTPSALFRHRDYFIYWLGLLLGHTGMLIQTTAQSWLIFQLTDSPFYLGLEGLCLGLPRVLFSAFGGAVVDRSDRKMIFVITQSAFFLMALFLGVMQHFELIRVWHLLMVSALNGLVVSFEQPVRQSILHHLVPREDLPNAFTLYQMVFNGSMLFGPSIGGLLIPWIDTQGCFFRLDDRQSACAPDDFYNSHRTHETVAEQNISDPRHARRLQPRLAHADLSRAVDRASDRQLLHQTLHSVHAGIRPRYSPRRRARPRRFAHGTGSRCYSWRTHACVSTPFS
jgi:hypothetical protein